MVFSGGVGAQYYAVFCANLMTFIYGMAVGWPSASLPLLKSDESPLPEGPLTLLQASWIGSILCIGGATGQMFFGWLADRFGRKPGIMFSFVPMVASWLLILYGQGFKSLFASRFLSGFSGGAAFQVAPLVVSEISNVDIRGSLGSFLILLHNAGIVLAYILCSYTNYYTVPWIAIGICFIFVIGYSFVPETPKYLMGQGKYDKAEKAIEFFKTKLNPSEETLQSKKNHAQENPEPIQKMKWSHLCQPATRKAFLIGAILMNTVCFSGSFTLTNYYETIFREAGSTLSPAVSSIIVASIQFAGSYCTTMTVEKAGRKVLILFSAYSAALCLATMGIYLCLKDFQVDLSSVTWLPLVCFSLLVFVAANGAVSVPYIVIGEIFDQHVRDVLVSTCNIINWLMSFVLVLIFPFMMEYLKMYGALWVFSTVGCTLATIIAFIMPETKGLSIETIVSILGRR